MEKRREKVTLNLYIKHHVLTIALNLTYLSASIHISPLNKTIFCIVNVSTFIVVIVVLLLYCCSCFLRNNFSMVSSRKTFNDLLLALVDKIEKLIFNHT